MTDEKTNVLILCTGNSARSILGEMLINRLGEGGFKGFSAGSTPTGKVNPFAVKLLKEKGYAVEGLRSKSWDEFSGQDAPKIDFVFTVCDNAAAETCPVWPARPGKKQPLKAHWGIPDPANVTGSDENKMVAFKTAYEQLEKRIEAFVALPLNELDETVLQQKLNDIGAN
jgi:arsenate reductase